MLTPRHSFGSISQRIDAFCPEMRAAQTTICADAALTQSARRRVRIGASRSGRGSCAARIQEWLSPRYRGSHLRAVEAAVVCSPVGSGATMRSALHACCGAGLFVRSVGKFQTAEQIACCGAERAFSKPQRFEAADSQCSVLDRSSPVPPGSIASNRSTFGGGEGWIKRSQDSAISSQVRFSDSLRVKCAIRSHSAAFARYSSFLFMGVFANGCLSSIAKRAGCSNYRDISDIEASGARNWKKPACGGWPRSGTTFARQASATSLSDFSCDRGPTAAVGSAARREASPAQPAERGSRGPSPDRSLPKPAA
jgi:hypothetical protein